MDFEFLKENTFLRKIFGLIYLISLFPVLILLLYSFFFRNLENTIFVSIILIALLVLNAIFSILAAYFISIKISKPITQFKKSATEIARGNFSHKIKVDSDDEIGRLAKIFNYMTTELRRLDEMNLNVIITEKNKTQTIIKNIADGIIVTDRNNKILVLNSVAEQWFELDEKTVINSSLEKYFSNYQELLKLINDVREQGNNHNITVEIKFRPKEFRKNVILQSKAARVVSNKGELIGIVTILRDITREKEIDQMKTELVSMVAHELRSPLTSISGFSELLLDKGVTKDQSKEYAEIILSESNRLGDLINKFLDISRIEAGKSQLNKTLINICSIVENIITMNKYQANKKNINVELKLPEKIPFVHADKEMMEEVILNLFSNAVKYSHQNTKIQIIIQNNQENDELLYKIRDEGFGISEMSLGKIFNKFFRVTDNDKVRDITGSGLGLSLVKEIIDIHNGNIWVESELGKGSTFCFTLPTMNDQIDDVYLNEIETEMVY